MESEEELHSSKPSPPVDVHVDPKNRRDITLHLDMDVTEDIEEELEQFSKLRRIGHFNEAKRYFEEHLENCIDNAYVLDQYGQFLLEISDIHTLTKLAREYPPGNVEKVASANWFLVCERALQLNDDVCPQDKLQQAPDLRKLLTNWPKLDSTELQCLINDLRVVKHGEHTAEEYGELYAHLHHEDRIWDFRDLCYGLLATKSPEETIHCLLNKYLSSQNQNTKGAIQVIQQHWAGAAGDEVTSLALLDIFTAFAMWALAQAIKRYVHGDSLEDSDEFRAAKMYLRISHDYATEVLRQNPLNLKSRPYLQWVATKVLVEKNTDTACCGQAALTKYLFKLRGGTQIRAGAFRGLLGFYDTVVYTPIEDEAPEWQPDASVTFSYGQEKALLMVARNARDLGDVLLEAACLQQLGYSSPNPGGYSIDLCNLWRTVGNRTALLRAYLYRYILKRSPDGSNDLRSDLLEFGDAECDPNLQEARFMILRALSTRSYEKTVYLKRAQDLNDETQHNPHDEETPPQHPHVEKTHPAKKNARQTSNHAIKSSIHYGNSLSFELLSSDDEDADNDSSSSVGSQRQSLRTEQRPRRLISANLSNEADQAELMPQKPATNILPARRDSMETSKDIEHREKSVLDPDSRPLMNRFRYSESNIDSVDDQNEKQREEERNDNADIVGNEVESLHLHASDEGNPDDL
ncbi:hypothetical protein CGCSCA2_v001449 [Colletotrichum siamense]|uniref:Uncharacterized protein n=1 Tax=Colletotrichum siamense TaxID=690259 RepID=A0A9P5F303_COLSI|nr:uncharacterized protein CGCS363_v011095 [Colletotrichum siamense]KAF4865432.1 hypothetical protein CGCSCA2_v001449 [Colletotrichum siamense]KAF5492326.1 hypothetical protein CGCS363_v011095 [Colletotrichum siamense]